MLTGNQPTDLAKPYRISQPAPLTSPKLVAIVSSPQVTITAIYCHDCRAKHALSASHTGSNVGPRRSISGCVTSATATIGPAPMPTLPSCGRSASPTHRQRADPQQLMSAFDPLRTLNESPLSAHPGHSRLWWSYPEAAICIGSSASGRCRPETDIVDAESLLQNSIDLNPRPWHGVAGRWANGQRQNVAH